MKNSTAIAISIATAAILAIANIFFWFDLKNKPVVEQTNEVDRNPDEVMTCTYTWNTG